MVAAETVTFGTEDHRLYKQRLSRGRCGVAQAVRAECSMAVAPGNRFCNPGRVAMEEYGSSLHCPEVDLPQIESGVATGGSSHCESVLGQ